jgi:hypothetical protein
MLRFSLFALFATLVALSGNASATGHKGTLPFQAPANATPTPIVVETRPAAKSPDEVRAEAEDRAEREAADRDSIRINERIAYVSLGQLVIFFLQLVVFGYQAFKLRETVNVANKQSGDMRDSIAQATRAAAAMENMAANLQISAQAAADSVATVKERTALQMRAYLGMVVGGAVYQDREKNLRFEAKPNVVNSGSTPAHDVRYAATAAILPVPLPPDFDLPPATVRSDAGAMVGPRQESIISAVVSEYVDDSLVSDIKRGNNKGLFIWGFVTYRDVFGEEHRTEFCQHTVWMGDRVFVYYVPGRNSAT